MKTLTRQISAAILLVWSCSLSDARDSVFETVNEADARLIAAFLAPRIELRFQTKPAFSIKPKSNLSEASLVAQALAVKLRDHGYLAEAQRSGDPAGANIVLTVMPLTQAVWVRLLVEGKPLFILFARDGDGSFAPYKESEPASFAR